MRRAFNEAEQWFARGRSPRWEAALESAADLIFRSRSQAFREALLGSALARAEDPSLNPRLPYINQGVGAFNGRTLDERVVNPFFQRERIPSSRGPYLAMFRRSVRFVAATRSGLRDKDGYDAFLELVAAVEKAQAREDSEAIIVQLLIRFLRLREASRIRLAAPRRVGIEQLESLLRRLLATPSGGRLPVIIIVALLEAISERFSANWTTEVQGINVADAPTGSGGDITVWEGDRALFAAEVTERPLDFDRVVATFNAKIAVGDFSEYVFFVFRAPADEQIAEQVRRYFEQGHELIVVEILSWSVANLATIGSAGRNAFLKRLLARLDDDTIPRSLKVAWNHAVGELTRVGGSIPRPGRAGIEQ